MSLENRRPKLANGRRIDMHAVISHETMSALEVIGKGNRSAAIEWLVQHYLGKKKNADTDPVAA